MKVAFYTLGCKANQYDTLSMERAITEAGHMVVPFSEQADVYIINTCTVTAESDRKARQMIGRAARKNDGAAVIVCGCYAQRNSEAVLAIDGVDAVVGTGNRDSIADILERAKHGEKCNYVRDISKEVIYEQGNSRFSGHARAYIKIQDGCDRYCTYCIIPHTRGPVRSRNTDEIYSEAADAVRARYDEVVLTGIRIASFGQERANGETLYDAIAAAEKSGIGRIRLGSLDPDCMTDDFIKKASTSRALCRHFHLSLQSGSDTVLKRMGRRYTAEQYAQTVDKIRSVMPDASFTTDVMCGFPGETLQEFDETCRFVKKIGFLRLHVFPYSRREGTPASSMRGQITKAVKQARAHELIRIGDELEKQYLSQLIGKKAEVVAETINQHGLIEGHARDYSLVLIKNAKKNDIGHILNVIIEDTTTGAAVGSIQEGEVIA